MTNLPTPAEIHAHLNDYVIGQDDAKRVLSVAVYNHYKRAQYAKADSSMEFGKSNIMMIGPTGSGKTLITSTLSKILCVPLVMADATVIVTSNNIGKEIDNLLIKLVQNAEYDLENASRGIIFIDEIDKLVAGINRAKGEGIQQALLKFIEGTVTTVQTPKGSIEFDTKNILFVVGGAFVALQQIIRERLGDTKAIMLSESELIKDAITEDLARFGLIPEFVGRIPVIVTLSALSKEALVEALIKPKNAVIKQYIKMFELEGVELVFEDGSLEKIAELAVELKTGARGLRTILEGFMRDVMYVLPDEKNLMRVTITRDVVAKKAKPLFEYEQGRNESELVPIVPKNPRSVYAYAD